MIALEFSGEITPDGTLSVPKDVAAKVPSGQAVRVLLLVEQNEDKEWQDLATAQFLKGYAEGDAIYDQLSSG